MNLPDRFSLPEGTLLLLDVHTDPDDESVGALLNGVIAEGNSYPQRTALDPEGFRRYWRTHRAYVVRTAETIVGAFYLRPNHPGRCSHIANGGFIVAPPWRGRGLGRYMGEAALALARADGFRAMQFNLVFAGNTASLRLWHSLGFAVVGRIPEAVRIDDERFEDALLLYRRLIP